MTLDERLERLLDEAEIRQCIFNYCHAADRMDLELLSDCYTEDAIDDHGDKKGRVSEFISWLDQHRGNRGAKQHLVGNSMIAINDDAAVCESYYICYIELLDDDREECVLISGRYVDHLVRDAGVWRIRERTVVVDWTRSLGALERWSGEDAYARGRSDGRDPAEEAFAALGVSSHRRVGLGA